MTKRVGRVLVNKRILSSVRIRKAPEVVKIEFYED